jgi:hypothetical protein
MNVTNNILINHCDFNKTNFKRKHDLIETKNKENDLFFKSNTYHLKKR